MRTLAIVAALLAASASAPPACAAVFTYVVSGTVDAANSDDGVGYFGALDDATFTATFTVDDAMPQSLYQYGTLSSFASGGGQVRAGTVPPADGNLRIGGVTIAVPRGNLQQQPYYDPVYGDPSGEQIDEADLGTVTKNGVAGTLGLDAAYTYDYAQYLSGVFGYGSSSRRAISFTLASSAFAGADYRQLGSFALSPASFGTFEGSYSYNSRQSSDFGSSTVALLPTRLTVTGQVPEPAAWMMFILGFGGIGVALRSAAARRRVAAGPA